MNKRLIGWSAGVAGVLGVGAMIAMGPVGATTTPAAAAVTAASASAPATFDVDPVHSFIVFKIKHLGASTTWGRFNNPKGTLSWDGENSTIEVSAKVADIDTANADRDKHLRSGDFFGEKEFPNVTFKSKKWTKTGEGKYDVTGDLTMHGMTKEITTQATEGGTGKNMQGKDVIGLDFSFTIKRSEFGIKTYPGALGEEVTVMVAIEGVKK
jgi:polyisoprenoid-binding protein YceI